MVGGNSKSASNSPIMEQKRLLSPSSMSFTNSPRIVRSNRYTHKGFAKDRLKEEARQILMDGQQKVIIIPVNKNSVNGKVVPQVQVCSANSSDSSEGKRTPPQRKHCLQNGNDVKMKSGQFACKPWMQGLKVPQNSSSLRSLKTGNLEGRNTENSFLPASPSLRSFTYSDVPVISLRPQSDRVSVRSLVSIGMGSTDGKKLVIRRVPTSPSDLLNFAHTSPCGVTEEDDFTSYDSSCGTLNDLSDNHKLPRPFWTNKLQFILACISYSIGLGNLWRFPYLCYKSGGGVFLIPYFVVLLLCSIPLLYMELAVGQFTRRGPIGALSKLSPVLKGVGLSSVLVSFFLSTYYNVIIAHTLFYFLTAFRDEPPWEQCSNRWNSPNCWRTSLSEGTNKPRPPIPKTPVEDFYIQRVLNSTANLEVFGSIRWDLVACSFIIWVIVYFTLWKSVRLSGRILYFTATVPFLLLFIFIIHALSFDGSADGLRYLLNPKWELLLDSEIWIYATAQNFNSIGLAYGSVISFASYNKYNNQIIYDTISVSCINAITSILAAIFTFATIGTIALDQKESIENVISDGPGLIFIVFPEALSRMPLAGFWSVLFFFTLLCLGLNSQFAIVEVVVTSIQDGFPNWIKKKLVCHEILVLVICLISFIIGLPNVFQGGIYFFQLIDYYVASISVIYIAVLEIIAISWIYGTRRLSCNIEKMTRCKPNFYFIYCCKIITPTFLICLIIISIVNYEPLTYEEYHYPKWAEILGWVLISLILISVPIFAVHAVVETEGDSFYEKIKNSLQPKLEDSWSTYSDELHDSAKNMKELEILSKHKTSEYNAQPPKIQARETMKGNND